MGRLIDADKLLETLQDLEPHCDNKDYERGMFSTMNYYMPKIINDEPTAYDVDKVIEELNELDVKSITRYKNGNFGNFDGVEYYIKKRKAIEIVKQGGVSDDVCEWKAASDGEFIQNPHTKRLYSNEQSMKNVYCNTCGKKIKIVGD